jgi:hypothetical protein
MAEPVRHRQTKGAGTDIRPTVTAPHLDSTRPRRSRGAKPVRLCPCSSDLNLFSYSEGIIDFDAEIPDGALDLGMSQQKLHGT